MTDESRVELAFDVGGEELREGFVARGATLTVSGDALLTAQLMFAMRTDQPVSIPMPVSPKLLASVGAIEDIIVAWFGDMHRVDVTAQPAAKDRPPRARVGAFFSGGVDSFHTLYKHQDEITDLVLLHGFDVRNDSDAFRRQTRSLVREVGDGLGKNVIEIELDFIPAVRRTLRLTEAYGPIMATIGHLLADEIGRVFIPASAWLRDAIFTGSHPLLDPLWSSERLEVVHDGAEAKRPEKVAAIAEHELVLRTLRVCIENVDGEINCGECEKCLRTMIGLRAVGALEKCTTFTKPLDPRRVARYPHVSSMTMPYIRDNLEALERTGADPTVERALRAAIRRWELRQGWMWLRGELQIRTRLKRLLGLAGRSEP